MREHTSRTVLVTGGSRGLGLAIVKQLAQEGFQVVSISRRKSEELRAVESDHPNVRSYLFDLSQLDSIHDFVKSVTSDCGRIYGLINNAALGYDGVLATMHDSQIHTLVNVNITSSILLTKYVVRSMLLNGQGRVVNISSIIAGTGFNGLAVYGASKAALIGFTKSLSRELGRAQITVNAVAPGYMDTEMTQGLTGEKLASIMRRSPLGRLATVDEVAAAVSFLLSDAARSVTGTTLTVDAGSTA